MTSVHWTALLVLARHALASFMEVKNYAACHASGGDEFGDKLNIIETPLTTTSPLNGYSACKRPPASR